MFVCMCVFVYLFVYITMYSEYFIRIYFSVTLTDLFATNMFKNE